MSNIIRVLFLGWSWTDINIKLGTLVEMSSVHLTGLIWCLDLSCKKLLQLQEGGHLQKPVLPICSNSKPAPLSSKSIHRRLRFFCIGITFPLCTDYQTLHSFSRAHEDEGHAAPWNHLSPILLTLTSVSFPAAFNLEIASLVVMLLKPDRLNLG